MFLHCTNLTPTPTALSLLHLKPFYEYMAVCTSISGIHVYSSIVLSVCALPHTFCSRLPHHSYPTALSLLHLKPLYEYMAVCTSISGIHVYSSIVLSVHALLHTFCSRLPHNSYPTALSLLHLKPLYEYMASCQSTHFYTRSVLAYHTTPTPTALSLLHLKPLYEYMAVCTSISGIHVYSSIVLSVHALLHTFCSRLPHNSYPTALSLLHLKPLYEYMAVCTSISGIHVYSSIVLSVRALLHTFCSRLPHNSYPTALSLLHLKPTVRVYGRLYIYFWNTCLLINSPVSPRTSTRSVLTYHTTPAPTALSLHLRTTVHDYMASCQSALHTHVLFFSLTTPLLPPQHYRFSSETTVREYGRLSTHFYTRSVLAYHTTPTPTALSLLHLKPLYDYMAVNTSISGIHVYSSIVLSVHALIHTFCSRLLHNSYPTALSLLHLKPLYEYMAVCTSISGIYVYSSIVLSVRALLHTRSVLAYHTTPTPTALLLLHLKPLYDYMAVNTSISGIHVYSSIVLSVRALPHTFCSRLPHHSYPIALSLLHLKPLYEYMAVCTSISGIHVYSSIVLSVRALLHTFCSRLLHNSYPHSTIASTSETTVRVYGLRALLHTFCSRLPHNSYPHSTIASTSETTVEYIASSCKSAHFYRSVLAYYTTPTPTALSLLHLKPLYEYMAVCTSISGIHVYSSIVLSVRALLHTFCSRLPHNSYPTALSLLHLKPLYEYMAVCTSISGIHVYSSIVLSVHALLHTFCSRLPHNSYPTALSLLHLKPLYEYMVVCTSISGIHVYSSIVLSVRALLHTVCSRLPHNSYPTVLSLLHLKPLYEYMAVCTSISGIHVYSSIVLSVRAFQLLLHTRSVLAYHTTPTPTALSLLHLKPLYEYMAVCTSIPGIHVYSSIVLSVRAFQLLLHTFCSLLPHNSYPTALSLLHLKPLYEYRASCQSAHFYTRSVLAYHITPTPQYYRF
ncbi:hypothetical protein J6590_084257 [Homalodisca vitripennis]|nr:hypothetical protein J6590_084257 [Homalodisca vitripennis]